MAKDESKLWQEVKKKITQISFSRLESWASAGVPDLLCYNKNNKFSPHQISFHIRHPINSFILAKPLGPLAPKLYEGRQIQDLLTLGHVPVAAVAEGWTKVQEHLVNVT
jgi:hypothetical protein